MPDWTEILSTIKSIGPSTVALAALGLSVVNIIRQNTSDKRSTLSLLTESIGALSDIEKRSQELNEKYRPEGDYGKLAEGRRLLNSERRYLVSRAENLINSLPKNSKLVCDMDYSAIAVACEAMWFYPEAQNFWDLAIKASRQTKSRFAIARTLRGYGAFQYRQGNFQNGESSYLEALELLKTNDQVSYADTLALWARTLFYVREDGAAKKKVEEALEASGLIREPWRRSESLKSVLALKNTMFPESNKIDKQTNLIMQTEKLE